MTTSEGGWGYPPMATLEGAVPGWPEGRTLTSAATPEEARAVLQAEAQTSVLHPSGLRWALVRNVGQVLAILLLIWFVVAIVRGSGQTSPWQALAVLALSVLMGCALPSRVRAELKGADRPRSLAARWRRIRDVVRGSVVVVPPAPWPPGSEAFAVLSTVDATDGIDGCWLLDRAGLPMAIGAQWLDFMGHCGWLTAGDGVFGGVLRQPVQITDAGRERLSAERERLRATAGA